MAQGKKTRAKIVERVKSLAAATGNIREAGRIVGLTPATAHKIVVTSDNFEQLRLEAQQRYVIKAWQDIEDIQIALKEKIATSNLSQLQLRDLTGALKDLRQTVENVAINLQLNQFNIVNNYTPEDLEGAAFEILGKKYKLKKDEIESRLNPSSLSTPAS